MTRYNIKKILKESPPEINLVFLKGSGDFNSNITANIFLKNHQITVRIVGGGIFMSLKVILLNGASSSGKSTLAKSLQKYIKDNRKEEYVVISIDDFLSMAVNKPIYEDDVFEISPMLCQKVLSILKIGRGVIIDHVITSERIYKQLTEILKEYILIKVQVTCPLHELEKREKKRKDRYVGSAKASCEYLYPQKGYDLTLDTLELSAKECSKKICGLLQ